MAKNSRRKIEKQAYDWLALMQSDCKTGEEQSQFQFWLDADVQHREVFEEVSSLWEDLGALRGELDASTYQHFGSDTLRDKIVFAFGLRPAVLLSVFTVFVLVLLGFYIVPGSFPGITSDDFSTSTAQIREIELDDDSVVTLGAQSAIEVDYSEGERRVELLSGEAFFDVERDETRPFVVDVGDAQIRVLGTKFEVRRSEQGVRVSVLEGKVEVIQSKKKEINGVIEEKTNREILTTAEHIRTELTGDFSPVKPVLKEHLGAWRKGRLFYENATLKDVISDVDRYYDGNIIIDTEDLQALPVSAAFRTDQIQEVMQTLSVVLPVTAKTLSNGDILIRRRPAPRS